MGLGIGLMARMKHCRGSRWQEEGQLCLTLHTVPSQPLEVKAPYPEEILLSK